MARNKTIKSCENCNNEADCWRNEPPCIYCKYNFNKDMWLKEDCWEKEDD